MNIYVELDNNYGDLKEYSEKYNSTLQRVEKTKEILLQQLLEKWNGELPKVTSGSNIFDLTSLLGK